MTYHLLYWPGTSWWSLGLARARLLRVSKTCPLRLPWSGGSFAYSAAHPWLLMAWATFKFLILYDSLPLGARLCLIVGFLPSAYPFAPFCSFATISCYSIPPFLLWCYLTPAWWASLGLMLILLSMTQHGHLGFVLHCLWALLSHLFPPGHP